MKDNKLKVKLELEWAVYGLAMGVLTKSLVEKYNKRREAERQSQINMKKYYENKTAKES